jgi:hypothetical protein
MGPCSSTTNPQHQQYSNNNNQQSRYIANTNRGYLQKQSEEFYYQNVQLNTVFGKNEFGPNEKVQFNFSIRNSFHNQISAIVSLSYDSSQNAASYQQIGVLKEEVCDQNGSIDFKMSLLIDYFFEKNQYLKIELKDYSSNSFVIHTTLGKIVGSRGQTAMFVIREGSQETMVITASTVKDNNINLFMNLTATVTNCSNYDNIFYLIKKRKNIDPLMSSN